MTERKRLPSETMSTGVRYRYVGGPLDGVRSTMRMGPPNRIESINGVIYVRAYREDNGCHVYVVADESPSK